MKKVYLLFILSVLLLPVSAQNRFMDGFMLRESFQSLNDNAEPAFFTYTNPKDKSESWLLSAAIGYDILTYNARLSLTPYAGYYKNTLIDNKQNNWQTGVSLEWKALDIFEKSWTPVFIAAGKYNKDEVTKNSSFQGNIYFTPLFKGKGLSPTYFWIPNNTTNFGKVLQFSYSPYLGVENENRIDTKDNLSSGSIYRLLFRVSSTIAFFPEDDKIRDKFGIDFDWQYRYNFAENVDNLTVSNHKFLKLGFYYTFLHLSDSKNAKISFDYVDGSDPTRGFAKQSYFAISLKVKFMP